MTEEKIRKPGSLPCVGGGVKKALRGGRERGEEEAFLWTLPHRPAWNTWKAPRLGGIIPAAHFRDSDP